MKTMKLGVKIRQQDSYYDSFADKAKAAELKAEDEKYRNGSFEVEILELTGTEKQIACAEDLLFRELQETAERKFEILKKLSPEQADKLFSQAGVNNASEMLKMAITTCHKELLQMTSAKDIIEKLA